MKKVAVIGCGALGSILARNFHRVLGDRYALCGLLAVWLYRKFLQKRFPLN